MTFKVGDLVTERAYDGAVWRVEESTFEEPDHWWLTSVIGVPSIRHPMRIERFGYEMTLHTSLHEEPDECAAFFS